MILAPGTGTASGGAGADVIAVDAKPFFPTYAIDSGQGSDILAGGIGIGTDTITAGDRQ